MQISDGEVISIASCENARVALVLAEVEDGHGEVADPPLADVEGFVGISADVEAVLLGGFGGLGGLVDVLAADAGGRDVCTPALARVESSPTA